MKSKISFNDTNIFRVIEHCHSAAFQLFDTIETINLNQLITLNNDEINIKLY